MNSLTQLALLEQRWQPFLQFVRYRRINFRRPRLPHYDRKLVLHVCKPMFEKPDKPMHELCIKPIIESKKQIVEENPYRTLLGREALSWFNNNNAIFIFHMNHLKAQDIFNVKVQFKRQNMNARYYDRDVIQEGLAGSRYECIIPLFEGCKVLIVFGSEPKVSTVLKVNKKFPQLILLAGIIDNRLLSKSEIMVYTKYPDLMTAQNELVSVLNSASLQLVDKLNCSQQTLVNYLEKHIELQNPVDKQND